MMPRSDDTIAAIATPAGEGAIAVVRLSGPDALAIADRIFRGPSPLSLARGYTAHPGRLFHPDGTLLDRVIATVFRAPHSYTGEDAIELSCHGGAFLTGRVFEALIASGARAAGPGEFTRRAFMKGKIDLTQAEAVADLISAQSHRAQRISLEQLQGRFGTALADLRRRLVDVSSTLELRIDFAEEGISIASNREIEEKLEFVLAAIDKMLSTYKSGKSIRDGISIAIIGSPNVGKSSLFNALLQHDRAIVTHIAGTTRDTIEEAIILNGVLFRITDTAGIRESTDLVESIGIDRSFRMIESSDIVLLVTDKDAGADEALGHVEPRLGERSLIIVRNKSDLLFPIPPDRTEYQPPLVHVSARTGLGLDTLRHMLLEVCSVDRAMSESDQVVTRERHRKGLASASKCLRQAIDSLGSGLSAEFIALDVRSAADELGVITGELTTQEILDSIFSSFCIGK